MIDHTSRQELILAQWQTCVEMANSVSQRRDMMNSLFVSLNLAISATVSIVWELKSILILLAGVVICILWVLFIRNYKLLNKAKFDIINSIEAYLPEQPFSKEWELLKNSKKYKDGTVLERFLPITFIVIYLITIIAISILKLGKAG